MRVGDCALAIANFFECLWDNTSFPAMKSIAGREVLRARQVGGESDSGQLRMAKLFDLEKISQLRKAGTAFAGALPAHNPSDSAMVEVFATLPKPTK